MAESAILLGATGLTGSFLLNSLLTDEEFSEVIIPVRNKTGIVHSKLKERVVDFSDPAAFRSAITPAGVIFCCIGTTMKKVKGDKALYKFIDVDIPVNGAIYGAEKGVKKFLLISAIGADSKSSVFYNRLKGMAEEGVLSSGIPQVYIFRPSLLTGPRKESRPLEKLSEAVMKFVNPLLTGKLKKYHSMSVDTLALAMKNVSKKGREGIYYYEDILKAAGA